MHMMPVMPHDEEDMDKRKTPSSWDPHDDLLLRHLKETLKLGWKEIASHFPNRTPNACQFRWRRLISGTLRTPQPLLTLIPLDQQQQGQPQQPGQMQQAPPMPPMQQRPPHQQPHPHAQMPPQGHPQHAPPQHGGPQHAPQQHGPPPHHMPQQQYPYPYGYPVSYGPGQMPQPPQQQQQQQQQQPPQQAQPQPPQQQPQQQPPQHMAHQPHQAAPQLHMPHHMQQQPPSGPFRPSLSPEVPVHEPAAPPAAASAAPAPPMLQLPPLRSVASPPTSPLQPLSNLPPKHAPWSKEEDDLLTSRKDLDVVELSVLLPNRLSQQIRSRLSYLNSDPTLCSPPLGTVTLPPIIPATDVAGVKVQEVPVSVSDTYFPSSFMRKSSGSGSIGGIGGVAALSAAASLAAAAHSAPMAAAAFSPPSKRTKLDIPPSTQPKLQAKLITELEKSKSPQTLGSLSNLSSPLSSTSSPGTGMISPAINLPTPITSGSNKPGASTLPNKRLLGLGTPHYFPSPRTSTPNKGTGANCYFDK